MEKDILSLRNIYRFLTVNDYPIYSTGVFREENRKGLTLTKFWQENLLYEFRSGYYGKMIWRTSGGRNRHISEMCNRSEVLKWYPQYTSELVSAINEKILIQQINQFKTCLQERKCDLDVLEKKIEAAISMFYMQDACFGEEIADYFRKNLADGKGSFSKDMEARLFFAGWMLTFLSLHAMAGEEMNSIPMKRLRQNSQYTLNALWESLKGGSTQKKEEVHFLTGQNNALCVTPLQMIHFFGREMELFDLREILEQGGYYLLSGMGGIGKTELLRQVLHLCVEQALMDEIAIIQYEGSLKDSCMNAFPNLHLVDKDNTLNEAMARIRMQEGKRVLTLVDNMNSTLEEDSDLAQLLTLPGTVILTSRLKEFPGFVTYEVKAPGRETGTLIFRDNYGKALSKDDKEQLNQLLEQEVWCHTLTLRLLGNTAKVKGWSVGQLKEKLEADGRQLLKPREKQEISLVQMYRRMYDLSELSESQVRFLRCFATLPYQNYTKEFLNRFLIGCFVNQEEMNAQLERLQECGWINLAIQGCSMHPVIKECVLSEDLKAKDVETLFEALEKYWLEKGSHLGEGLTGWCLYCFGAEAEDYNLAIMVMEILKIVQGEISEQIYRVVIMIASMYCTIKIYRDNLALVIQELSKRCRTVSKEVKLWSDILIATGMYAQRKADIEVFWNRRKEQPMSKEMLQIYEVNYAYLLTRGAEYEKAESIFKMLLTEEMVPWMRIYIECSYIELLLVQTRYAELQPIVNDAIELAEKHDFPNGYLLQCLYLHKYNVCMDLGNVEEARQTFAKLSELVERNDTIAGQYVLEICKGFLSRNVTNLEEVCESQRKVIKIIKILLGEGEEYAENRGNLALLLHQSGNMEEAEEHYLYAISVLTKDDMSNCHTSRIYNNMADMYICWNKPQQAIECMQKSTESGRELQGIGLAERYRNFARAYQLAGVIEQEYENLKQAVPLLAEAYGPDHERTVAMRERLEEVEKLLK